MILDSYLDPDPDRDADADADADVREVRSHAFPPILQLSSLSLAHTAITTLPQVFAWLVSSAV